MKTTVKTLRSIIRNVILESLSTDANNPQGMQVPDDQITLQAIENAAAIPRSHDWKKNNNIHGYCHEWIAKIDQCVHRKGQTSKGIAKSIARSGTDGRRGWQCAYAMFKNIPGNEEHMKVLGQISDALYEMR